MTGVAIPCPSEMAIAGRYRERKSSRDMTFSRLVLPPPLPSPLPFPPGRPCIRKRSVGQASTRRIRKKLSRDARSFIHCAADYGTDAARRHAIIAAMPTTKSALPIDVSAALATRKKQARRVLQALKETYPDANCELNFTTP